MEYKSLEFFLNKMVEENIEKYSPKRTDKEIEEMYLDWFNNFLSTERFREYYNLSIAEAENIIDRGREINHSKHEKL